jgi:hypothetical protein
MNTDNDRRRLPSEDDARRPVIAGVSVREDDVPPDMGLHWIARLFRAVAVLLFLLMIVQTALGVMSAVDVSYGVLIAEAVRMLIFSALLWGFGALADLFVRSHHDLRATRVLLARIAHRLREPEPPAPRR